MIPIPERYFEFVNESVISFNIIIMAEVISEDQPRIKFQTTWQGHTIKSQNNAELDHLARLQMRLETLGVIPILNDGLVGGNCAMRAPASLSSSPEVPSSNQASDRIFVSKSGKIPGAILTHDDFVTLTSFDRDSWSAAFQSASSDVRPSSDSPLHAAALSSDACQRYGWQKAPQIAVHGHALAEGSGLQAAAAAGMPISQEETLFSTPEDLDALEELFKSHPYPTFRCFIRRGHGFFLLADDVADAEAQFEALVLPLLE